MIICRRTDMFYYYQLSRSMSRSYHAQLTYHDQLTLNKDKFEAFQEPS